MANRNNVNTAVNVEAEDEDVDDIPDVVVPPGTASAGMVTPPPTYTTTSGMPLEALQGLAFNDERDAVERKKLNNPTGDWLKTERWEFAKVVYAGDCVTGDIDPEGRTILTFSGKPDPRQHEGMEYQPTLFLRISPDIRYKKDKPTEVDNAYKLYNKAKEDLYLAVHNEKPKQFVQLITMLTDDIYKVRTMNGDNGPIIVDIKDMKSGERRR